MLAVPLIDLIVTSAVSILDKRETSRQFEILLPLAKVSIVASELIHELQKERGKTVGLITSGCNDINRGAVDEQRGLSDPPGREFLLCRQDTRIRTLSAEFDELVDELKQQTDGISPHLSAVDGREIAVPANVKSYTSIIKTLITIISKAVESSPSQELTHDLLAYVALVEAKEASGLERAIGATLLNNIAKGQFSAQQFNLYYENSRRKELSLGAVFAGKEQRALFGKTVQGPDVEKVIEWRKVLHALPDTRDAQGISGKTWFDIATKRINLIYAVERNIGEHAIKAANRLAEEVANDQRNLIVIDTILLIIAAAIGIFVGVRITRGLNAITSDINTLSSGRFDFEVAMQDRTDEFGAIAKSLEGFRKERGGTRGFGGEDPKPAEEGGTRTLLDVDRPDGEFRTVHRHDGTKPHQQLFAIGQRFRESGQEIRTGR